MQRPSVAVAIPAFNEAEGIAGFVREIDKALSAHVDSLQLVVVDDASSDETRPVLEAVAGELEGRLEILTNETNSGHGPSLVRAYRRALAFKPDYVLQVDGDGQFHGSDLRRVLVLLTDDAHAVSGVRRFRQDPWFRMTMTRVVRHYVSLAFAVRARDPNCPLRGYEAEFLRSLLDCLPRSSLIPNLYLTILAARRGVPLVEVDVSHRVRRGASADGTTWRKGLSPIPWRLVRFSIMAFRESRQFRTTLSATSRRAGSAAPAAPAS
jgi:glycosyltransferase involved in cell wall biosynthesis